MHTAKRQKTDEEILELAIKNPEAFAEIINRYRKPFLIKATRIVGGTDEAEDVVQDTFVRMYLASERFLAGDRISFRSWAYRILYNTAISAWRKKKRRGDVVENLPEEALSMIADEKASFLNKLFLTEEIMFVLSKMPVMLSRVMHYKLAGMTDDEIAKEEGISEGAVRVRFHRAKKIFKKMSAKFNLFGYGESI